MDSPVRNLKDNSDKNKDNGGLAQEVQRKYYEPRAKDYFCDILARNITTLVIRLYPRFHGRVLD